MRARRETRERENERIESYASLTSQEYADLDPSDVADTVDTLRMFASLKADQVVTAKLICRKFDELKTAHEAVLSNNEKILNIVKEGQRDSVTRTTEGLDDAESRQSALREHREMARAQFLDRGQDFQDWFAKYQAMNLKIIAEQLESRFRTIMLKDSIAPRIRLLFALRIWRRNLTLCQSGKKKHPIQVHVAVEDLDGTVSPIEDLPEGTKLTHAKFGVGTYVKCTRPWVGANTHTVQFSSGEEELHTLHDVRVLYPATMCLAGSSVVLECRDWHRQQEQLQLRHMRFIAVRYKALVGCQIREDASLDSQIVGQLHAGDVVVAVSTKEVEGVTRIQIGWIEGEDDGQAHEDMGRRTAAQGRMCRGWASTALNDTQMLTEHSETHEAVEIIVATDFEVGIRSLTAPRRCRCPRARGT